MFHVDKWLYSKISPLRLVTHWIHVFITTDHLLMEDLALQKSVVLQVRIAHPISGSVTIRRLFLNSQQRSSSTYLKWKIVMKKHAKMKQKSSNNFFFKIKVQPKTRKFSRKQRCLACYLPNHPSSANWTRK